MAVLDKLWSALRADPELRDLGDEQNQAVLDALVAVVHSDDHLDLREAREFDRQIQLLPWRWAQDERAREKVIATARDKADGLADLATAEAFVQSVAQRLPGSAVREKVYRMCLALTLADGFTHAGETRLLALLASAFGLEKDRIAAIAVEVGSE